MSTKEYTLSWGSHCLNLGERTHIMGIVNVTPDSFSDGGVFFSLDKAVEHGEKLVEDGADIIDIGGESTRPFSENVPVEEEIKRVVPVIRELEKRISVPISIDTTKAETARQAIDAGASIINDVGALRLDPDIGKIAAEYNVPVILMHMLGDPKTMQKSPSYKDVIEEVKTFLKEAVERAEKFGISKNSMIVDPGIGFGKTVEHNLLLIKNLSEFNECGVPILVGPSRKAFIRNILKSESEDDIRPDLPIVETGTQAVVCAAVMNGAHIVRVHDVVGTSATIKIVDSIKNS